MNKVPCCCRYCVGEGEGAGEALFELVQSDAKDPFDWLIVELRLWATGMLLEDDP